MLWRYSWYLQRLKYHGKHQNIVVFAMSWRYSWYLQRLKYNGKHTNIVPNTCKKQENTLIVNHALGSVGYVMHLECDSPTDLYFRQPSRTIQEFTLVLPMRVRSYRSTYPVSLIDTTVDAKGPKHYKEIRPRAINATSHMYTCCK